MNMALDLAKKGDNIITLAVHPGYVATKMTGYIGEDDMEICMAGLVGIVEVFGTPDAPKGLVSGAYAKWDGTIMEY